MTKKSFDSEVETAIFKRLCSFFERDYDKFIGARPSKADRVIEEQIKDEVIKKANGIAEKMTDVITERTIKEWFCGEYKSYIGRLVAEEISRQMPEEKDKFIENVVERINKVQLKVEKE